MPATTRVEKNNTNSVPFYEALAKALKKRKVKLDNICSPGDPVNRRILEEYGAVFVANKKVMPPPAVSYTHLTLPTIYSV